MSRPVAHETRYAYLPALFGPGLPADPMVAAQTAASIPVTLSRHAEAVALVLEGAVLARAVEIGGHRFEAGDEARPEWSLVDEGKGTRLSALLLRAEGPEGATLRVITAGLPLKPGQRYDLSMALPQGAAGALRAGGVVRGTRILTQAGKRPVEDVAVGDPVWTETGGFQPVLWHGVLKLPARGLAAPLRLPRGLLGLTEDLLVAGAQLIRVETDSGAALVPAAAFERAGRAQREFGTDVVLHQLLLPDHALIHAAGLAVASVLARDRLGGEAPEGWPAHVTPEGDAVLPRLSEEAAQRWIG